MAALRSHFGLCEPPHDRLKAGNCAKGINDWILGLCCPSPMVWCMTGFTRRRHYEGRVAHGGYHGVPSAMVVVRVSPLIAATLKNLTGFSLKLASPVCFRDTAVADRRLPGLPRGHSRAIGSHSKDGYSRRRAPDVVTLREIAPHGPYQGELLSGFDVLCDTFSAAGMAEFDQSKKDATGTFAMLNIGCEGTVELNHIKHQVAQI